MSCQARLHLYLVLLIFLLTCFAPTSRAADLTGYKRLRSVTENLSAPTAVAVDHNENLYVTEPGSNSLLLFSPDGKYLKKLGGLDRPISVAVDERGRIFIGSADRGDVGVYDKSLKLLFKLGSGDGEFLLPGAIAIDSSGDIYVADSKGDNIKVYTPKGSYKGLFCENGKFHFPTSIAIDKASGELIISDLPVVQTPDGPSEGARVQIFDRNGKLNRSFGDFGQGQGRLTRPMGVAIDSSGRIHVSDSYQNVVQVFDREGKSLRALYDLSNPLRTPMGIAISGRDVLFVSSLNTGRVEVFRISRGSKKTR